MIIGAIVAIDLNHAIGKNNQLLWHLPADLKFFKQTTMGCPIIMGRKTYQSIGKLLPGRKNIIITRNKDFKIEGADIYQSLNSAISECVAEKVFVIGGSEIYTLAMPMIKELYITIVKHKFDADTFFSKINTSQFNLVWEECHEADEKNKFDYCFQKWLRN